MPSNYKISKEISSPADRLQNLLLQILFGGYFVYLTLLLLSPNPYPLVGSSTSIVQFLHLLSPLAHGISFAVLTVLALLAFRAFSHSAICACLLGYAASTELLQMLIPPRTAEWQDWFQDIAGIAAGILLAWVLAIAWKSFRNVKDETCPEIAS